MTTAAPQDAFSGVKPVEERHRLDEAALTHWLQANVEGFTGPLTLNQFKGGQSNPTYQLVTPARKYVLRKKPGGKLLPSAHAVDREYRVISALYPTGFPVARPYALCTDDSVAGAMFYVMEMVEGRIIWDGVIPDVAEAVESPRRLRTDPALAQRVLDLVPAVPALVWGRDESGAGEMWNSNSLVAWLIARSGLAAESVRPPTGGRAPGWDAGLVIAGRQPADARS